MVRPGLNEDGASLYLTLAVLVLIILVVAGIFMGGYYDGKRAGQDEVRAEWDRQKVADEKAAAALRQASDGEVAAAEGKAELARQAADESERKWREVKNAAQKSGVALATCQGGTVPVASGVPEHTDGAAADNRVDVPAGGGGRGVVVTWEFIRLWDSAWTDSNGQPVFGDPSITAGAAGAADSASPYGPGDVLDNHQENARRGSACRRQLNSLIDLLDSLEAKWNQTYRTTTTLNP